jgi:hypothetical protein
MQNINQYGFTESVSYLMGAVQRHQVEKFCIAMKKTYFGCSLDGDSAFEVVNRFIQTRELYCAGETGQYWQASHHSYQNSQTNIKMNGQLSGSIVEGLGVKQGRTKSSDHYKVYIAPLLDSLDSADLGVWVGNVNVSVSGVADDVSGVADDVSGVADDVSGVADDVSGVADDVSGVADDVYLMSRDHLADDVYLMPCDHLQTMDYLEVCKSMSSQEIKKDTGEIKSEAAQHSAATAEGDMMEINRVDEESVMNTTTEAVEKL